MTESRWPDPTPEEDEQPRWLGRVIFIAAAAAAAFWVVSNREQLSTFTQSFRLPAFETAEIAAPDLRGRSEPSANTPPATASISEEALSQAVGSMFPDGTSPTVREVDFGACVSMIADMTELMHQEPTLVENTATRRVARFKLLEGDLTVTCADGQMTLENRN
jgi:hypothetical protein